MNQKIALVVYPEFSFQEIGNLSSLFRWGFDTRTVVVSGDKNPVKIGRASCRERVCQYV